MMRLFEVDRNDKCPCGSGKKYKKCCMDRVEEIKREILKEYEGMFTATGLSIVNVISALLGFKLGNKVLDTSDIMELMMEAWMEEEDEEVDFSGSFKDLLRQKSGLKMVRVPGEMFAENEREKMQKIFEKDFVETLLLRIARSIRYDEYSREEMKVILWAISIAAEEGHVRDFISCVYEVSKDEIVECNEKLWELVTEKVTDMKKLRKVFEEISMETSNFLHYSGEHLKLLYEDEMERMISEIERVELPLYSIYSGLAEIYVKNSLNTQDKMEKVGIEQIVSPEFFVAGIKEGMLEYFLAGIEKWISEEIERIKKEKKDKEEIENMLSFSIFLLTPLTPAQLDFLYKIYISYIKNFIENLPKKIDYRETIINSLEELFDEKFVEKYTDYLKKKGLFKEAGYVEGCFYKINNFLEHLSPN
ncbi:hypothetical protein AN618_02920 [Fervidicola ferrireducens]|uniref:Protein translocase subunit SecA n=1 Tax=Fervidicola ferrireducens TaxID=520764 RepID=A0A140LDB1_9FIRM|nr:SEC-C domain-containing protein [Fervidicola ferrireducens]KXG78536.1 hypothetical protein AN618_02920 [Fervidicola ferrireducens]